MYNKFYGYLFKSKKNMKEIKFYDINKDNELIIELSKHISEVGKAYDIKILRYYAIVF